MRLELFSSCSYAVLLFRSQVTKKEDGGLAVASGLSFNSAHKDNGDIIGGSFVTVHPTLLLIN